MEQLSVFTRFKGKGILLFIGFVLILSGCQAATEPINAESTGFFNHYVIYPLSYLIKSIATLFGGNYGLSIILVTLIVRLVLMPLC